MTRRSDELFVLLWTAPLPVGVDFRSRPLDSVSQLSLPAADDGSCSSGDPGRPRDAKRGTAQQRFIYKGDRSLFQCSISCLSCSSTASVKDHTPNYYKLIIIKF